MCPLAAPDDVGCCWKSGGGMAVCTLGGCMVEVAGRPMGFPIGCPVGGAVGGALGGWCMLVGGAYKLDGGCCCC